MSVEYLTVSELARMRREATGTRVALWQRTPMTFNITVTPTVGVNLVTLGDSWTKFSEHVGTVANSLTALSDSLASLEPRMKQIAERLNELNPDIEISWNPYPDFPLD